MEAYKAAPERFFYDKVQNRVVFVEYDTPNNFQLATGRLLYAPTRNVPKWFKYVALPGRYFLFDGIAYGNSLSAFICEDCASACSMARLGIGIALCGTSYGIHALVSLLEQNNIKDVVVCLDVDAQRIAIELKSDLQGLGKFNSVKAIQLSDDAKYLSIDKIKKELKYVEGTDFY